MNTYKKVIEYTVNTKEKTVEVKEDNYIRKAKKKKGDVFVKDIGLVVAILKLINVNEKNIDKIVDILREDFRNRKGYSKKI